MAATDEGQSNTDDSCRQNRQHESKSEVGCSYARLRNGMQIQEHSPPELIYQKQKEHERNHCPIPHEDEDTYKGQQQKKETGNSEKRDHRIRCRWIVLVEGNSVRC